MSALGQFSPFRHVGVLAVVGATSVAGYAGLVGESSRPERFDAKQITFSRAGADAVAVREVVDQDFGTSDRHGYQRRIPNDFGVPIDISAESPDAPAQVNASPSYGETTIRVGDPDVTISGQHRYILRYTYPEAHLDQGVLQLDVIGAGTDNETGHLEVVVTGFELANPECDVGGTGATGGCALERQDDGTYRAEIAPVAQYDGVTIRGDIVGETDNRDVSIPPIPERRSAPNRVPLTAGMAAAGLATAAGAFAWFRRRGSNEVYGVGAADAAYGTDRGDAVRRVPAPPGAPLPPPAPGLTPTAAGSGPAAGTRLVPDDQMGDLATIEFVPPAGVAPWQGALALRERVDENTVAAWFSGHAATGALTIEKDGDQVRLERGNRYGEISNADHAAIDRVFSRSNQVTLGKYDKHFAETWRAIRRQQTDYVRTSGWWRRAPFSGVAAVAPAILPMIVLGVWVLIVSGAAASSALGLLHSPAAAIAIAVVAAAIAAVAAYGVMAPARSATGSAVALRTESFRRFLAASEARHVEWAWQQGLLREYSAWAVALGTADAWQDAMTKASVPPAELSSGPMVVYAMAPTFRSAHTAPSSSGSGGGFSGGGFGGGGVGGGGGGGSSGSW